MKRMKLFMGALLLLLMPAVALADSISPETFSGSGPTGASYIVHKTVTIDAGPATTSKVDVYFLADTTGSMGDYISAVKTGAEGILSSTAGLGDVQFAVGEYKDFGDTFVYRLNTAMTGTQAAAQAGINLWSASGGGDGPEAQLYAMDQIATQAGTGWRAGSAKILVWFGDYEGHDPSGVVTEAIATGHLQGTGIKVEAISVGYNGLDLLGQASRIATATGGDFYSGINADLIVTTITNAITEVTSTYSSVGLDLSAVPAGLVSATYGGPIVGTFDRTEARTFEFDVTFTDLAVGTHTFPIYATVDGGRVATETDTITSSGATGVPEPGTMLLLGAGLIGLAALRRRVKEQA